MKEAVLYEKLDKNLTRCQACSWQCTIAPDQTGICGVRLNQKGQLFLTVYGQAVGIHLDPVEKKPLNHFLPGSTALSFGTVGCDFGCRFCQNWHQSQPPREIRNQKATAQQKIKLLQKTIKTQSESWSPKAIVQHAVELGAKSIAYTYNEPTIFVEYAHDTAKLAKKEGLKNIFVSNGYESEQSLKYLTGYLDAANVDLKSFRPQFYQQLVKGKLEPVLNNIKKMHQLGIHLELTTLIIPGQNDSRQELTQIAKFIYQLSPDIPWHVSAFFPSYQMKDIPPTPLETLHQAHHIGKKVGLRYVYPGNLPDEKHTATYCPKCNQLLIRRREYTTKITPKFDQEKGSCKKCHTKIAGVWPP